jgi:lysophospholipase L1-like esterase
MDRHELRRRIAAPLTRCWLAMQQTRNQSAPRPSDAPEAYVPGPDADRVLIFGSGPAVGWGVLTNEIALPGSLARALSLRTGRGTEVELVADMRITVGNALPTLRAIDTSQFDVIVVVLGANDAVKLLPLPTWREQLSAVLSSLDQKTSGQSRTFVTAIPPVETIPGFASRLGRIVAAHALQMNEVTARLCDSSNATFVPLPAVEPTNALGVRDGQTYRKWAATIADIMVPQLDELKSLKEIRALEMNYLVVEIRRELVERTIDERLLVNVVNAAALLE